MTSKDQYIQFALKNTIPIFFQPLWLNAMSESWNVVSLQENEIQLYFVYSIDRKWGFTFIRNSFLSPYLGFISNSNFKLASPSTQQKFVESILKKIPSFSLLNINCLPYFNDIYFKSTIFNISKKTTNILYIDDIQFCYSNLKDSLKRQIKKAQKNLIVFEKDDIQLFYELHKKTFSKNNSMPPTPFSAFEKSWHLCKTNKNGNLIFIKDAGENIHAALFLCYDNNSAYYLAGGTDANFYGSGAMSLLMWYAIEKSAELGLKKFDFEGSSIPSVNRFFQNFNPLEKKYIQIQKTNNILFKLIKKK